jgi:hypothetical protein
MSRGNYAELPQFARGQSVTTFGGERMRKSVWRTTADEDRINSLFTEVEGARQADSLMPWESSQTVETHND